MGTSSFGKMNGPQFQLSKNGSQIHNFVYLGLPPQNLLPFQNILPEKSFSPITRMNAKVDLKKKFFRIFFFYSFL